MSFSQLGLNPNILKAIKEQGYSKPTLIQKEAIPMVLGRHDILAAAQTGTGKTAAFTLPLLEIMSNKKGKKENKPFIKALILTPTRELAAQVAQNIEAYSQYLPLKTAVIFGGVGINSQKSLLRKGVDIVIATPGRLLDHVGQKSIDLSRVEFLVLDEADRMLDMGFIHDIKKVMAHIPKHRQTLLFSATFSKEIKALSQTLLNEPKLVEVTKSNSSSEQVNQVVHYVLKDKKRTLLSSLIRTENWNQVLVFTRTKHGANKLSDYLNQCNISAAAIHGNKSQGARTKALNDFKAKTIKVLVATDIAARGIDIELLPHVVNFELPNIPEDYVHRIGRTGRAGNEGVAMSLVCSEELEFLENIEKLIKMKIEVKEVEGFTIKALKKVQTAKKQNNFKRRSNHASKESGAMNGSFKTEKQKERKSFDKAQPRGEKTSHPRRNSNAQRNSSNKKGRS
ncbi:DEAD/DEAH box helicase [Candidatus Marinarcus aquaticus]|uniref:DEAD-box ATP-dependent RNA helicase RhpA n=1 Tax=Candidatus Marinarcus aquaticus TaxID=2044504 RepID=A0A4Q0XX10_9BACT|nr:DEAD/DEAH box helicase [Candidatus Marinarcus aquaticus]RXJ60481.1 ATP-dependent RNA helicase RhlE [Candidatus Marinarcus aquaticus]